MPYQLPSPRSRATTESQLKHVALPPPTPTTNNPPLGRLSPLLNSDIAHTLNDRGGDGAAALSLHPGRRETAQTVAAAAAVTTNPWR